MAGKRTRFHLCNRAPFGFVQKPIAAIFFASSKADNYSAVSAVVIGLFVFVAFEVKIQVRLLPPMVQNLK